MGHEQLDELDGSNRSDNGSPKLDMLSQTTGVTAYTTYCNTR